MNSLHRGSQYELEFCNLHIVVLTDTNKLLPKFVLSEILSRIIYMLEL